MTSQHDEFRNAMQPKTLAELEKWEIMNGPLSGKRVKAWQWQIVQEIKRDKEAARRKTFRGWYADHRDQIVVGVIAGAVSGLIVAWITFALKP